MISTQNINQILDDLIGNLPDPLYVGLSTTAPVLDPTDPEGFTNITEPTAADYSRAPLFVADWDAAVDREKTTINDIVFSPPVDAWGLVTHVVVYDETAANVVFVASLIQAVNLTAGGDQLIIPAGTITIAFPA
jgi:hypothetical protein